MTHTVLITDHLRRPVPGGIGTYIRGLVQGMTELGAVGELELWQSRLPPQLRSRLWDHGIGRVDAELVHAPSFAFPRVSGRLVVMIHDLTWRQAPEAFPSRGRRWHERRFRLALEQADHLVVPSIATADAVMGAGAGAERVTVIEEGADHLPAPDDGAAAGVVEGEFILTVGTREPRKNLTRLAEAYRRARPRFSQPWPLVVVGPHGWGKPDDLDDVVTTGHVEDAVLAALYRRARAFVYVPLVEGFGLPPAEALNAGVPVVASAGVPSCKGAAIEVDPTDVDAIAAAMVAAAVDDKVRDDLVGRGSRRAAELTWRSTAAHHLELWRSLR